jgi:phosphoribosylanthranilate isomerase
MTKVKICGITRLEDALHAAEAGADALGFVFYEKSPRHVDAALAGTIIRRLPPFITSVGLFVNPAPEFVNAVLVQAPLDVLQFHGDETDEFCRQFSRPFIKALRMSEGLDLAKEIEKFPCARGILLDAYDPHRYGGTGQTFEWQRVHGGLSKPIIVAGGLTPENVAMAIAATRPWAVDVSGGVEQSKGIKQRSLVEAFIEGAKRGQ